MAKRTVIDTKGWGPTAFQVALTPTLSIGMFLGTGYFVDEHNNVDQTFQPDALDLFLELQRDGRLPDYLS